jgi:pimeloyl-ACP methyl ester carboxylesterase
VPVSNSLRLARMVPGARVAVLKRSGHCPQEEVPEGFGQIVSTFLEAALDAPRAKAAAA